MIRSLKHFSKRFYVYQNERFPIVLLVLSLLPANLSSAAVVSSSTLGYHMILAVVASLIYLFHIRVNDEERDFEHDIIHHSTRPLHRGVISLNDLKILNVTGIFLFVLITFQSGPQAILIGLIMIVYSYVAKYDFFCKEKIRKHFFIYNTAHIVQILLLQIFVYAVIARSIPSSTLLFLHFLFTMTGTIIFEFARKVKIPGDDGTGKDTYTHHIGFKKSLILYALLTLLNTALFLLILVLINQTVRIPAYIFIATIAIAGSIWLHWIRKTVMTDKLMQGIFLLIYAIYNISIYIFIH